MLLGLRINLGKLGIGFREAAPEDASLVFHSWLRSHRHTGDWPKRLPAWRYYAHQKFVIERLLARCHTIVACNEARPTQVIGYLCFERNAEGRQILHWVFVKRPYREQGVCAALFRACELGNPVFVSHYTLGLRELNRKSHHTFVYDPFLLEADYEATESRVEGLRQVALGRGDGLRQELLGGALPPGLARGKARNPDHRAQDGGDDLHRPARGPVVAVGGDGGLAAKDAATDAAK